MADDPRSYDASGTGTPRWVKVFGIIVAIVILAVVIVFLVGGEHGPGRHLPPDASSGLTLTTASSHLWA